MSKISHHLKTIRSLTDRIETGFEAGQFDEVENLSRLLLETVEMVRVHAKVALKYSETPRVTAKLSSNITGTLWELRADDGRSILFHDRSRAEAYATGAGWDIKETISYL